MGVRSGRFRAHGAWFGHRGEGVRAVPADVRLPGPARRNLELTRPDHAERLCSPGPKAFGTPNEMHARRAKRSARSCRLPKWSSEHRRQLLARVDAQLAVDVTQVVLDRLRAEEDRRGRFARRPAA